MATKWPPGLLVFRREPGALQILLEADSAADQRDGGGLDEVRRSLIQRDLCTIQKRVIRMNIAG